MVEYLPSLGLEIGKSESSVEVAMALAIKASSLLGCGWG